MATDVKVYDAEGTAFVLRDPDWSTMRDTRPGHAYEPIVLALLGRLLRRPGAVFADIGALYGYLTVWAALHAPQAEVVAFEPESSYMQILRSNLVLNGCSDVRTEQVALVDKEGAFAFSTKTILPPSQAAKPRGYLRALRRTMRPDHDLPSRGPVETIVAAPSQSTVRVLPFLSATLAHPVSTRLRPRPVDRTHEVRGITFDDWVAQTSIRPTIVKIDVHGAEGLVLDGMKTALREHVEHVLLELHTCDLLVKHDHRTILATLLDAGFELFEVRGFRASKGWLEPVPTNALDVVGDQATWSLIDLYFMKFFYARRTQSVTP